LIHLAAAADARHAARSVDGSSMQRVPEELCAGGVGARDAGGVLCDVPCGA